MVVRENRGSALMLALVMLTVLAISSSAFYSYLHVTLKRGHAEERKQVCLYIAEGGIDKAIVMLRRQGSSYSGEAGTPLGEGSFTVSVGSGGDPGDYEVDSVGRITDDGHVLHEVRLKAKLGLDAAGNVRNLRWTIVR